MHGYLLKFLNGFSSAQVPDGKVLLHSMRLFLFRAKIYWIEVQILNLKYIKTDYIAYRRVYKSQAAKLEPMIFVYVFIHEAYRSVFDLSTGAKNYICPLENQWPTIYWLLIFQLLFSFLHVTDQLTPKGDWFFCS